MEYREAFLKMLKTRDISRKELARRMNITPGRITRIFQSENIRVARLVEVCDAMDYEVAIRPKHLVRKLPEEMIIS